MTTISHFPTLRRIFGSGPSFRTWWPLYTTASQRQGLLRMIAVFSEEKLPLLPLLEVWAADERGAQARRLDRLIRLLHQGTPLPDAVEQVRGLLRDEDVLAIRFGAQSGMIAPAIRDRMEELQPASSLSRRGLGDTLLYFIAILLVGIGIITFIQIWIFPQIKHILSDYDMTLSPAVVWQERFNNIVANYWWLGAIAAIVVMLCFFVARPGRYLRKAIWEKLFRPVRERRAGEVLRKLSLVAHAGRSIPGAISTLARYHFDPTVRHKLLFVRNEVEQGADIWRSMAAVDLLAPAEERVMHTAERLDNRTWALRQLADGKQRRTSRRLQRVADWLLPALAISMGAFVLFQALTIFQPLTEMIWQMAR